MIIDFETKSLQKSIDSMVGIYAKSVLSVGFMTNKDPSAGVNCLVLADQERGVMMELAHRGLYISYMAAGSVLKGGEAVVKANYLASLKLPGPNTRLTYDGRGSIAVKSGKLDIKSSSPGGEDDIRSQIPEMVPCDYEVDAEILTLAIRSVDLSVSGTEGQANVQLIIDQDGLRTWAHNSVRSAYFHTSQVKLEDRFELVVPATFALGVLDGVKGPIKIGSDGSSFAFQTDRFTVIHPIREVDLLDIESEVKQMDDRGPGTFHLTFKAPELLETLVSIGAAAKPTNIIMQYQKGEGEFRCSGVSSISEAQDTFKCVVLAEPEIIPDICLNAGTIEKLTRMLGKNEAHMSVADDRIILSRKNDTHRIVYGCAQLGAEAQPET